MVQKQYLPVNHNKNLTFIFSAKNFSVKEALRYYTFLLNVLWMTKYVTSIAAYETSLDTGMGKHVTTLCQPIHSIYIYSER